MSDFESGQATQVRFLPGERPRRSAYVQPTDSTSTDTPDCAPRGAHRVLRRAARLAAAALVAVAAYSIAAPGQASVAETRTTAPAITTTTTCRTGAWPTTAKVYANLWAKIPTSQWGAADVSVSVRMPDRRVVWLYGDTASTTRFVHSTAIVQNGSCLRVSHGGAQLIPNDDDRHIYWLQGGRPVSGSTYPKGTNLALKARSVEITDPTNPWGFADGGFSRTACMHVDAAGNVTFLQWGAKDYSPAPYNGPGVTFEPHHFGYSIQFHPWARLASGKVLTTMAQNYDDGILRPFSAYKPIWMETAGTYDSVLAMYP